MTKSTSHVWLAFVLLFTFVALSAPRTCRAQSDDPCHQSLGAESTELAEYDRLVGAYLDAADEGDHSAALQALDQLWATCDQNLRVQVFRAKELLALGRCEDATAALQAVSQSAVSWHDVNNSRDAMERAELLQPTLRSACYAHVEVRCADQTALVRVGAEPETTCPATFDLPAGEQEVVVRADGMQTSQRVYPLGPGNNFIEIEALQPLSNPGWVEFRCAAPGAEILMGAERFGCPATRQLEAGPVSYEIVRARGARETGMVEVPAGGTVVVELAALATEQANFIVTCEPDGATVEIIEGQRSRKEACPVYLDMPRGAYQVVVSAPGHRSQNKTVEVIGGRAMEAAFTLQPRKAWSITARAAIGVGQELVETTEGDTPGTEVGTTADSQVVAMAQLEGLFVVNPDGPHGVEVGPIVRVASGDHNGLMVGAALDYIFVQQNLSALGGIEAGYGTVGMVRCSFDEPLCDESEQPYFGGRLGVGLAVASDWRMGMLAAFIFGEVAVADLALTIDYGF